MPTMTLRCCIALTVFSLIFCSSARGQQKAGGASIADVYTDKARYAPNEGVTVFVQLKNDHSYAGKAALKITFWYLGQSVGEEISQTVDLPRQEQDPISIDWTPPDLIFADTSSSAASFHRAARRLAPATRPSTCPRSGTVFPATAISRTTQRPRARCPPSGSPN